MGQEKITLPEQKDKWHALKGHHRGHWVCVLPL
jgi:hypothetical protein